LLSYNQRVVEKVVFAPPPVARVVPVVVAVTSVVSVVRALPGRDLPVELDKVTRLHLPPMVVRPVVLVVLVLVLRLLVPV
jgi:hypothetical protein